MLVKYVRDVLNRPFACIVGLQRLDGSIGVGWSLCHPKDHFNKKRAREIAFNRAVNGYKAKPASRPTYSDENTDEAINHGMQEMQLRAERALSLPM